MPATITPLPNVIVPIFRSDGFDAEATHKAYGQGLVGVGSWRGPGFE